MTRYLDDLKIGDSRPLGSYTFTAESIIHFARQFDPQPFHLSEEGGRNSLFGGLCASGWHVASAFMRLLVDANLREMREAIARGENPPTPGPSPGFRDLRWIKPVMAGDTLTYETTVHALRASGSRPGWGIFEGQTTAVNQRGELVFSMYSSAFIPRRKDTA